MEYAKINLKGLLKIKFSELIYFNNTEGLRSLQAPEQKGLLLDLSICESENGLDEDVVEFEYTVIEFNEKKVKVQLDFACPECISSFETDKMTIIGRSNAKVLFEYDVDLPPQVDRDDCLVSYIELGAFLTICIMGGTVVLAILFDLLYFQRWQY